MVSDDVEIQRVLYCTVLTLPYSEYCGSSYCTVQFHEQFDDKDDRLPAAGSTCTVYCIVGYIRYYCTVNIFGSIKYT